MTVECDVLAKDIVVNDSAVLWVVSLVNAVRSQTHTLTPDGVTQMLLKRCVCASVRACVHVCVCVSMYEELTACVPTTLNTAP